MSPPVEAFPAAELPIRILSTSSGRRRKQPVDLERCALQELVQYDCDVERRKGASGPGVVVCHELVRLFRRLVALAAAVDARC
jgi:hypothetical protein